MDDLASLRRAAQDGLTILPAQVLALCDEVGRARRWAAAWKAAAKYERLTSAAGWAGAVAGVETANMMLRGKVEALESALRPFAEQEYNNPDALLTARRLLGLPDFPPIGEALAELHGVWGPHFDGVDPVELRAGNDEAAVLRAAITRALESCPFCQQGECRAEAHQWLRDAIQACN